MEQTESDWQTGAGGYWWKEGGGIRQTTCMNDPRTWRTVWELTVGVGSGMGRGEQRGKNCDNYNRIPMKNDLIRK